MNIVKYFLSVVLFLAATCSTVAAQNAPISNMTNHAIDSMLTHNSTMGLTVTERMEIYSDLFLGMGYNFTCIGDGSNALLEDYPLVNFEQTNCMSYCEHVLALAISDSWDNFFNNLQQIRYSNGMIGMRTRNHYTMADWLPENSWLLDDVSRSVGGRFTKTVTRTISHREFFANKGITDLRHTIPDRKITVSYVPLEYLADVEENIRSGDVMAIIYRNLDNIFSAHMMMAVEKEGVLYIRESTTRGMTTFDTPYTEWIERTAKIQKYIGLSFMRVRSELNTPDKIILPWEIHSLKKLK